MQSLTQICLGLLAHLVLLNSVHCKSRIWPFNACAAKSMTVIKGILIKLSIKITFFFQTIYNQQLAARGFSNLKRNCLGDMLYMVYRFKISGVLFSWKEKTNLHLEVK